jgi:Zn ribbon nucleic-acid-binding protein
MKRKNNWKHNGEYSRLSAATFFRKVSSEALARNLIWEKRFGEAGFLCPECQSKLYWELKCNPEIRECRKCHHHVRLRSGTIFEHSKVPMLEWVRALFFVMQDKRGVSALQLQRQLGMSRYATVWYLLHKIRRALMQRDAGYQLKNIIELDGGFFGKKVNDNKSSVFIAVERKEWVNEKGKAKSKAGFAKVYVDKDGDETKETAQTFVTQSIKSGSTVRTDKRGSYKNLSGIKVEQTEKGATREEVAVHLPWVHKFISNAKTWLLGTHHGINKKYVGNYLGEYTYRFNRRHDPNSLFSRALSACVAASPVREPMLCG